MNENDFEKQLSELKLKSPSENYHLKAQLLLKNSPSEKRLFSWRWVYAMGLMLSLGLNFYLFSRIQATEPVENLENTPQQTTIQYTMTQGAMVPYGNPQRDVVIILENKS